MKKMRFGLLFLCMVMIVCSFSGCAPKTPITETEFKAQMEAANFEVVDATETTETNGLAIAVLVAANENYQIDFYVLTDSDTGAGVFHHNKSVFNEDHMSKSMSTEVTSSNYNYYAFTADGNFHMIARIGNTMLYCEADKAYKAEIVDYVKQLGYK